jgi:chitodextrinase
MDMDRARSHYKGPLTLLVILIISGLACGDGVFQPPEAILDEEAPTTPTDLTARVLSSTAIEVEWSASLDEGGVAGYQVYRDGHAVAETETTSFRDGSLEPATSYSYTVAAFDSAGNVSSPSLPAMATTKAPGPGEDVEPPTHPVDLTASAVSSSRIDLSWSAASDDVGVVGYRVFRNGSQVADVAETRFSDMGLSASTTYSYSVAAYDAAGNVSEPATVEAATRAPSPSSLVISNVEVETGRSYEIADAGLDAGAARYVDRPYVFTHPVSDYLEGLTYIRTANDDKSALPGDVSFLSFDVNRDVVVHIVHDDRTPKPAWLTEKFLDTGVDLYDSDDASEEHSVYRAAFPAGKVVLGSNSPRAGSATAMYSVIVEPLDGSEGELDDEAPTTPSGLSASGVSPTQIDLTWSAASDNVAVTGYLVFRDGVQIANIAGTSFSDTGLDPGTSYSYTVAAHDGSGNVSEPSDAATAATESSSDTEAPTTPTELSATAVSATRIDLSWSAASDDVGVTGYFVYRDGAQVADVDGTDHSDTGLDAATSYSYTVAAHDAAGNVSEPSQAATATTEASSDTEAPTTPADLSATAVSTSRIDLGWSAASDNVAVTGYFVYRDGAQVADVDGTDHSDTGLEAATSYSYTVAAHDAAGNVSEPSQAAAATTETASDGEAPTVPTGLSATAMSTSRIDLSWNPSSDNVAVTGYAVYRDGARVAEVEGTDYSDTDLSASTTYSYTVSAYDAAGNSSGQSSSVNATTDAPSGGGTGVITDISFDFSSHRRLAPGSDNWPLTWADDGHQYTTWGDGGGFGGTNSLGRVSIGVGRVEGSAGAYAGYNVNGGASPENPSSFSDGKSVSILFVNGSMYMLVGRHSFGDDCGGIPCAFAERQLWRSSDYGAHWSKVTGTVWRYSSGERFGFHHFINMGRAYGDAIDGYVYVSAVEIQNTSNFQIQAPGELILMRVPTGSIEDKSRYEYFSGTPGSPAWSSNPADRRPVLTDPDGFARHSITYIPQLDRFLMLGPHSGDDTGNLKVWEAPKPWGPWNLVREYREDSGTAWNIPGEVRKWNFWDVSSKCISADGLNIVITATGKEANDSWNTIEATLTIK